MVCQFIAATIDPAATRSDKPLAQRSSSLMRWTMRATVARDAALRFHIEPKPASSGGPWRLHSGESVRDVHAAQRMMHRGYGRKFRGGAS